MIGFPEAVNEGHANVTLEFVVAKKCSISGYVFISNCHA
jgi:hypothetical protein